MKAALDKAALAVVGVVGRLLFTLYGIVAWALTLSAPFALLGLFWLASRRVPWALALLAGLVLVSAGSLYRHGEGTLPASVGAGGLLTRLTHRFIAWLGTIKFFTSPLSLVEDPGTYRITGLDIRALLDGQYPLLQPGDILLRGYRGYLDGELIRRTGGARGAGRYLSHAALYVGPLNDMRDREIAARRLKVMGDDGRFRDATDDEKDRFRKDPGYFQPGSEMVVHSMAKGVHVEDVLTFVRCDYLVVLRLPEELELAGREAENRPLVPLSGDALSIDQRLTSKQKVSRAEIVAAAHDSALGQIGSGYDFLFDSYRAFHRFSCSEFVYYCFKSVHRHIGLEPRKHSIAGLFQRTTVTPADICAAWEKDRKLELVWSNVPKG